jgi:streptomycin 6-kinase
VPSSRGGRHPSLPTQPPLTFADPPQAAECRHHWGLIPDGDRFPAARRHVEPVRLADGTPAVLKLGPPDDPELDALEWFAGGGGVRVLELDRPRGAVLLERVVPGTQLRALVPEADEEATAAAAAVMRALWRAPPAEHRFRSAREWGRALSGRAAAAYADLCDTTGEVVVVHGDLHHENILRHGDGWLAIDPAGVVAEREYETGALLRNPFPELLGLPHSGRMLARRADQLAEALQLDRARIGAWAWVQAELAAAWAAEDGEDPAYWLACAELLA